MKVRTNFIDPHRHNEIYDKWKEKGYKLESISPKNQKILIQYLCDMEIGKNISPQSKKGARSSGRLRTIKGKLNTFLRLYEKVTGKDDITDATDDDFLKMNQSTITLAIEMMMKIKNTRGTAGKKPETIVAGVLYLAGKQNNDKRTQRDIANAIGVIEITIRKISKEIISQQA